MWTNPTTTVNLTQGNISDPVNLNPAETAHCQVERTGVVTDLILVQVFGTLETSTGSEDTVPLFAFSLRSTETSISFVMRGIFGFQVLILNGEAVPTGSVTADLNYRKDGIDVG